MMSLQQEHQAWQEEKIKQALDASYALIQKRNSAYPARETLEAAIWCSTRGSVVSNVLGQVPKNLQGLVRNLRDQIQQTSQATSTKLEQAKERINFPEATIDVIINNNQGVTELILPIKEDNNELGKRIYSGFLKVIDDLRLRVETNTYQGYIAIITSTLDYKKLSQKIKEDLDTILRLYNIITSVATNFSFEHEYDNEPKQLPKDRVEAAVKHDLYNKVITVQPPERNGKVKFLPIDPKIKADIVQMIKDGETYQAIRDRYQPLLDQEQLPDSRLQCFRSHITMKTY